jgi:hypothetical protein
MNDPQNPIPAAQSDAWARPAFEVIDLACELSAYAPDDGGPLF